jgi:hypothetical protein
MIVLLKGYTAIAVFISSIDIYAYDTCVEGFNDFQ